MGKKYLKKSYIQEGINLYGIRFLLSFFKNRFKANNKVLVKSCDGIGDILVRTKLAQEIIDKYGKENVYFLMQKNYVPLGEMLGYNCISFSRKERKNFFTRLKKMYTLNNMGFSKYINIEFTNDITTGNLFIKERIGCEDLHWQVERNNKYYTKIYKLKNEYVLNRVKTSYDAIFDTDIAVEKIMPNIQDKFKIEEKNIVIAVGSTGRHKVCSPILMCKYIKILLQKFPDRKIQLVGAGTLQEKYANFLVNELKNEKIENLVGKTSICGVFELLAKSFLFLGFDSGLYNACFAMRKKGIALFSSKEGLFIHNVPWIEIITPTKIREDILDKEYPEKPINSITPEEFEKGIEKLINREGI